MKESDIRPGNIFDEYLRLSARDAQHSFSSTDRLEIPCPACGENDSVYEFTKHGFQYRTCNQCRSLFQSPRPRVHEFEKFYENSESSKYWAEVFFPAVAESRRSRIFTPRVDYLFDLCEERQFFPESIMDVGAGYGIFLEEWHRKAPDARLIAVEPSTVLADVCRDKGFEVVPMMIEKVTGLGQVADLVTCFEVLEHVYDPLQFIMTLKQFIRPGGYLLISTLGVDGFDIQVLWEKSKSISPPHHINFLSIHGFRMLFERAGIPEIDIKTPGKLDVDIVRNAASENMGVLAQNRFLEMLISDHALSERFQSFLVENNLSSHTWVLARVPEN